MGEAKRRHGLSGEAPRDTDERAIALTKMWADQGGLTAMGFQAFAKIAIPDDAPSEQRHLMQLAFMAGASHLWGSILALLTQSEEWTQADRDRLDGIARELEPWGRLLTDAAQKSP